MLRNRVPRRGRRSPPLDIVRGTYVETFISFEECLRGAVQSRDYTIFIDNKPWAVLELERHEDDRRAWEGHWKVRRALRKTLQRGNGPAPLRAGNPRARA